MNYRRIVAVLIALIMLIGMMPAMAENTVMYVNYNTAQVYSKASTSGEKIAMLVYGDQVTVAKSNSSWAQITNANGDVGYCRAYQLSAKNPKVAAVACYSIASDVPVYKYPSESAQQLMTLAVNDQLDIL